MIPVDAEQGARVTLRRTERGDWAATYRLETPDGEQRIVGHGPTEADALDRVAAELRETMAADSDRYHEI